MAYDLTENGDSLGPYSEMRCWQALEVYREYGADRKPFIALGAGFADRKRFPDQIRTMAEYMRAYLKDNLVHPDNILVGDMRSNPWGSGAEMMAALMAAHKARAFHIEGHNEQRLTGTVRVVTSNFHARRCRLLAHLAFDHIAATKEKWCFGSPNITSVSVPHPLPRKELFKERAKYVATVTLSLMGDRGLRKLGILGPAERKYA